MIDFCAKYANKDWGVADDVCNRYKNTGKPVLAVVDINNDGFRYCHNQ